MRVILNRSLATALLLAGTLLALPQPSRAQFASTPNQAYAAARTQAAVNTKLPAAANIAAGTGAADVAGARRAAARTFRYNPYPAGYPAYGDPGAYGYGYSGPGTNPYHGSPA